MPSLLRVVGTLVVAGAVVVGGTTSKPRETPPREQPVSKHTSEVAEDLVHTGLAGPDDVTCVRPVPPAAIQLDASKNVRLPMRADKGYAVAAVVCEDPPVLMNRNGEAFDLEWTEQTNVGALGQGLKCPRGGAAVRYHTRFQLPDADKDRVVAGAGTGVVVARPLEGDPTRCVCVDRRGEEFEGRCGDTTARGRRRERPDDLAPGDVTMVTRADGDVDCVVGNLGAAVQKGQTYALTVTVEAGGEVLVAHGLSVVSAEGTATVEVNDRHLEVVQALARCNRKGVCRAGDVGVQLSDKSSGLLVWYGLAKKGFTTDRDVAPDADEDDDDDRPGEAEEKQVDGAGQGPQKTRRQRKGPKGMQRRARRHMPRRNAEEADAQGARSRNLLQSAPTLMLVHGYCAGGNPWPKGDFTNAHHFILSGGSSQSVSNDAMARDIHAQAQALGMTHYGGIGHSQGGNALLHLYNYYWSGLDNAGPGRLIQAVGTPWRGTELAGSLANLAAVFGAGCGTVPDLTYGGASNWLGGIASWATNEVHYYTSSFETKWWRYDYCHLATDAFLDDPEDGVVERWSGTLQGGVNRGHTTKECHTTGMRDPAQYLNNKRNAEMNSNAAR